jgi:hypothetical protein
MFSFYLPAADHGNIKRVGSTVFFRMKTRRPFLSFPVRKLWTLAVAGAFCAAVFWPPPAHALLDKTRYTDTELVGYAFSKLGKVPPDYQAWINNMEVYRKSSPLQRQDMDRLVRQRLEEGYYNYSPDDDLIHILADVTVTWNSKDFDGSATPADEGAAEENKTFKITFGAAMGRDKTAPYFPYLVGKLWIAVIPKDIGAFLNLSLPPAQARDFLKKAGVGAGAGSMDAIIDLKLRPLSANANEPLEIDDTVYWLMLSDIANLTLWNEGRDGMIWSYDAPWFESGDKKAMIDLKQ